MSQLILGHWCVGVSTLVKKINCAGGKAVEILDYPIDLYEIQKLLADGVTVFSYISHGSIAQLERELMPFALVYPAMFCRDEYITRMVKAGRNLAIVDRKREAWVDTIAWLSSIRGCASICLGKGEYIPELDDPRYQEIPFPKE